MSVHSEINFDELKIEIAPGIYWLTGSGSANFDFDRHGSLENVDGIFLKTEGKQTQFWLRSDNPLFNQIKYAIVRDYEDEAWEKTGASIRSDRQEHSTLSLAQQGIA